MWVGKTHCRVAASGQLNSSDRFPAMNVKSGRTPPDPFRKYGFRFHADCLPAVSGHSPCLVGSARKCDQFAVSNRAMRCACIASRHSTKPLMISITLETRT